MGDRLYLRGNTCWAHHLLTVLSLPRGNDTFWGSPRLSSLNGGITVSH